MSFKAKFVCAVVLIAIVGVMALKEIMAPKIELVQSHVNDQGVGVYIASGQLSEDIDTVLHKSNEEVEAILLHEEMQGKNSFNSIWE